MQPKSPKIAQSARKLCPRASKMEPKSTLGPLFSGFGDPLFSCNPTVVLLYFMGSRVPGTTQNEEKTRSLHRALQKTTKKHRKCAFSAQRCRKLPPNEYLTLYSTAPCAPPVGHPGGKSGQGGARMAKRAPRASNFSENRDKILPYRPRYQKKKRP